MQIFMSLGSNTHAEVQPVLHHMDVVFNVVSR